MSNSSCWVFKETLSAFWTVGFYGPNEKWYPESDWDTKEQAAHRVHYLNGGNTSADDSLGSSWEEYQHRFGQKGGVK